MSMIAGAAEMDITPPLGTQLAGDIGRFRPVEEVRDPLYARALFVESYGVQIVLVQLDLCVLTTQWTGRVRDGIAQRLGLDRRAVMVCATQTHSAPAFGDAFVFSDSPYMPDALWWLRGGDPAYHPVVVERAIEAAVRAHAAREAVTVQAGSGVDGRVAFNRRFVMRDGTAKAHPADCDPRIRYSEGPIDPEVGVVRFTNAAGEAIALLLHHTCHPVHGYPQRFVTADWPGAWAAGMKQVCGEKCIPIVINGCCGNIHHHNHLDPHHVDDYHRVGRFLTETATRVLGGLEAQDDATVAFKSRQLQLPWRQLPAEKMQQVRALLHEHPEPIWLDEEHTRVDWEWVYAVSLLDLEGMMQRDAAFPYEVGGFRIGPVGLLALGGEPFVEGQLRIKLNSPTFPTYIAHMSNDYGGYIPTPEALERGGYETNAAHWSKLAPEALDTIADAGIETLSELFA
jgi:hypothetical protein